MMLVPRLEISAQAVIRGRPGLSETDWTAGLESGTLPRGRAALAGRGGADGWTTKTGRGDKRVGRGRADGRVRRGWGGGAGGDPADNRAWPC